MAAPDPLLAVRDIHTYYGDSYVLHGLSLALSAGEIVAILGRNGMGKTTLIRSRRANCANRLVLNTRTCCFLALCTIVP